MNSVHDQIRSYYGHVVEGVEPVAIEEVFNYGEQVRPVPAPRAHRRWHRPVSGVVAFSVAAALLLVLGIGTFLLRGIAATTDGDVVSPEVTNTTVAPFDDASSEWGKYETSELTLVFAPADAPADSVCPDDGVQQGALYLGSWFKDTCYIIPSDGLLYRTVDGVIWESTDASDLFDNIVVRDGTLVSWGVDPVVGDPTVCGQTPEALVLGHTTDVEHWTLTRIPLAVVADSAVGCSSLEPPEFAAGPTGFLILGGLHHELAVDKIMETALGANVAELITQMTMTETTIEVVLESGELRSIDLTTTEYWGGITDFLETLGRDAPSLAGGAFDSLAPFGWWSPDGLRWRPVKRGGPLGSSPVAEITAVANGFEAASVAGREKAISWLTVDGSDWVLYRPVPSYDDAPVEEPRADVDFGTLTWAEADQGMRYGDGGRRSTLLGDPVDGLMVDNLYIQFGPTGDLAGDPIPASGSYTDGTTTIIPVHLIETRTGGLLVSPDDGSENWQWVPGPWATESYDYGYVPFAVVPDGGFIANVHSETTLAGESITTYLSDDGVNWRSVGEPPYLDGVDSYFDVHLWPFAGRLRADVQLSEDYGDIQSWESTDGVTWEVSRSFEGGQVETLPTRFGWVAITWLYDGGFGLWASEDGAEWVRLTTPDGFNELRISGVWSADVGATFIYLTIESGLDSRTWIGTFRS